MAVFMISLAGVPPTGGFWGKLLIFQAAIERGGTLGPALAVVMLVNSVVSVFYYLVVPRQMFLRDAADRSRLRVPGLVTAVVVLAIIRSSRLLRAERGRAAGRDLHGGRPRFVGCLVYVCLCVALSDRVVRAAVADGATTMDDLAHRFDAGAVCGGCTEELQSVLSAALAVQAGNPVPDVPGRRDR